MPDTFTITPICGPMPAGFRPLLAYAAEASVNGINAALAGQSGPVPDGMRYAVRGGKAVRALLVLETSRLYGVDMARALPAAAAIECLHAYSLVHDDLPCMDDDALRRGQPTVHVKWDEATAILVGDALQALAFELVTKTGSMAMVSTLALAAGVRGMVGGQAADIAAESAAGPLSLDQIIALQAQKTGALIVWSTHAGATMAGRDVTELSLFGENLGLAFQIADDVLDVTGDAAKVGKAVGKDRAAGKATFVSLLGLDGAKRRAAELVQEASDSLSGFGSDADTLRDVARFVLSRDK